MSAFPWFLLPLRLASRWTLILGKTLAYLSEYPWISVEEVELLVELYRFFRGCSSEAIDYHMSP